MSDSIEPGAPQVRPAATVMLARDADEGIEVFMLRRTKAAVFAADNYVFPGGRVDEADGEGDEGFRLAAVRECYEEAGVLLAVDVDGRPVADGHPALAHRDAVYDGRLDLRSLAAEHGLELETGSLAWTAHWITPKGEVARRFDTHLYTAEMPPGQTGRHDDNETVASMWARPAELLAGMAAGDVALMPPTVAMLGFAAAHGSVAELMLAARAVGTPPCILPKVRLGDGGRMVGIAMPGDPGYDELD